MQNVYLLIDWFLPAYKAGGPIQSVANLVAQENKLFYHIICSTGDVDGSRISVVQDRWTTFNAWTKVWYSSNGTNWKLLQTKEGVLFINGIYSWHFNLKPIVFSPAKRKIVSVRGMLHPGALSQKPFKKKIYLAAWKLMGLHRKVEFHASTDEEKKFIQSIFGNQVKIHVAANFPRVFKRQRLKEKSRGELNLVSVGLISPMKNYLLVLSALKQLGEFAEDFIQISYHIFGAVKDPGYWTECERLIRKLPANIRVQYHGDVEPSKVEDALQRGHIFILPSKSENFGHALYEALSAGKPVITSHGTPWNSLSYAMAGINVNPENLDELSNAILHFAKMEQAELEEWSKGAKAYSEKAIDLEEIKQQYRRMFGIQNQPSLSC